MDTYATRLLSPHAISIAAEFLQRGEVVAFPTETVYGLGAAIFDPLAIAKVFKAKRRPSDNPLIAHISSLQGLLQLSTDIPSEVFSLAEAFWPGPLTILLPRLSSVPDLACAGLPTIGVRMPAHPLALELIDLVGEPLVAPSANLSGLPSSTTAAHVLEDFDGKIAAVLDGGACTVGLESTILQLGNGKPKILRPGRISQEEISSILGYPVEVENPDDLCEVPVCPGMKYRHYAPRAYVHLMFSIEELRNHIQKNPSIHRMVLSSHALPNTKPLTAKDLYADFRRADQIGCQEILVFCHDEAQRDLALMNRLSKAANRSGRVSAQ